jgi:hypothetical protein
VHHREVQAVDPGAEADHRQAVGRDRAHRGAGAFDLHRIGAPQMVLDQGERAARDRVRRNRRAGVVVLGHEEVAVGALPDLQLRAGDHAADQPAGRPEPQQPGR